MNSEIERIEKLLYSDKDFQRIQKLIKSVQHYSVLIKENDEAMFSKIMGSFLDPGEWHGYGTEFIRRFLFLLVDNGRRDKVAEMNLTKIMIEDLNLRNAKVSREVILGNKGRIDILVEIPGEFVFLIENKIFSQEGENQTNRYYEYAKNVLIKNYSRIGYCYVTPDGSLPGNNHFTPMSFDDIYKILIDLNQSASRGFQEFLLDIFME